MPEHTPAPTPARSLYGFFMFFFSKTILFAYLVWSIIPNRYLYYINIYYFPHKYWSTAIPIQCLVALTLFAFIIYPSVNLILTCGINSKNTICDKFSTTHIHNSRNSDRRTSVCVCRKNKKCMQNFYAATPKELDENTVRQLRDLDMRYVSKKLYYKSE